MDKLLTVEINKRCLTIEKSILEKSEYFAKMFSQEWYNSKQNLLIIDPINESSEDRTLPIFFTILSLYDYFPELTIDNVTLYFRYSQYFMIESLHKKCEWFICSEQVNRYNVIKIIKLFDITLLTDKILEHFKKTVSPYYDLLSFIKEMDEQIAIKLLNTNENLQLKEQNWNGEINKYYFAKKLATSIQFNDKILDSFPEESVKNLQQLTKNWLISVNYNLLTYEQMEQVILDGYLDYEYIKKIITERNKYKLTQPNQSSYNSCPAVKYGYSCCPYK